MSANNEPFDPVVLDLSSMEDYVVLIHALRDAADEADYKARIAVEGEEADCSLAEAEKRDWEDRAERARRLIEEVERQIDENARARKGEYGRDL